MRFILIGLVKGLLLKIQCHALLSEIIQFYGCLFLSQVKCITAVRPCVACFISEIFSYFYF